MGIFQSIIITQFASFTSFLLGIILELQQIVNNNLNVKKIFPKLTFKIAKNEYRTQNNKRYLTQKGFWERGFWKKGTCSFFFQQKEHTFGEYTLLGPKKRQKEHTFGKTEKGLIGQSQRSFYRF